MTQTIYVTRGLPASGKSTWADRKVAKSFGSIVRVERDMLRDQLYGPNGRIYSRPASWSHMTDQQFKDFMNDRENAVTAAQQAMVSAALNSGKSVIVSDTNLPAAVVKSWVAVARKHNVTYEIIEFDDISVDECIARDSKRANPVGGETIRKMAKAHLVNGNLRQVVVPEVKVLNVEPYANPNNLPSAVIVDIDGTLANMSKSGRSPYDWMRVGEDEPVEAVIAAVETAYLAGREIIVMSGRDGSCRGITHRWLLDHLPRGIMFHLFMRAEGDNRKDDIVKYELFNEHVRDKYHVQYVLDDRPSVCRMWRSIGLFVMQVGDPAVEF